MSARRRFRIISWIVSVCVLLLILLQFLCKPIIEFYASKFTGRKVTLSMALVNPFSGSCYLKAVSCTEYDSDSIFLRASSLSLDIRMRKMLRGKFEMEELTIRDPFIHVIQLKRDSFNFTSLVQKLTLTDTTEKQPHSDKPRTPLGQINVLGGLIRFEDRFTPVDFSIKNVAVRAANYAINNDSLLCNFEFQAGTGEGKADGFFNLNAKTSAYQTHFVFRRFDLGIIGQYLKDFSKTGTFSAMINADFTATGNLQDARNLEAKGGVGLYNFSFKKHDGTNFAAFRKMVMKLDRLNPAKRIYDLDSISLVEPYLIYEKYDKTDNVTVLFGKANRNEEAASEFNLAVEIANYIKLLAKNFFHSRYSINRLGIYNADLHYKDHSLEETFSSGLRNLTVTADSLHSSKSRVHFKLSSGIIPYGNFKVDLGLNPKDSSDFELSFNANGLSAAMINPYLVTYSSFPLNRGTIGLNGNWRVSNGMISSNNHLLLVDPRVAPRVEKKDRKWLPMRLIMAIVRERSNAIDYEIPISGNLKDPKFHFSDVILDILTNIFVKPPTSIYRYEVEEVEREVENYLSVSWKPFSTDLSDDQKDVIEKLAAFLAENPKSAITLRPHTHAQLEREYIASWLARKKYYLNKKGKKLSQFTKADSVSVRDISDHDEAFNNVLEKNTGNFYSLHQKAFAYAGPQPVDKTLEGLTRTRLDIFLAAFREKGVLHQVRILKEHHSAPFNGFSEFRIEYNGTIPAELQQSFQDLQEYNDRSPRSRFRNFRKRENSLFRKK